MKTPDLLHLEPHLALDQRALLEALGLAFLGKELGTQLHDALARAVLPAGDWDAELFANDLFVRTLIRDTFQLRLGGREYPVNHEFLFRTLVNAPTDPETVELRQGVLRELESSPETSERVEALYRETFDLLSLMKTPGYQGAIDLAAFHLDILRQARRVIDAMAFGFSEATSALRRLHETGVATQASEEYQILSALLEYESGLARLGLEVVIGADGRLRDLRVRRVEEVEDNRFYRGPFRRLLDRWGLAYRGYRFGTRELLNRLINDVFRQVSPVLVPLVQLLGHLEVFLTARSFRARALSAGLEVSLARIDEHQPMRLEGLFNPLLLALDRPPVPCRLVAGTTEPVTLVTGPNSGGKTRLLQAIGLTQLLGQNGLYVPARSARIRIQRGLFVSLVEEESAAAHTEGRLGRELMRIRSMFEEMPRRSMVILDELCSGTNPSEGVEVFAMVLRLLRQVEPSAFVTTHFLDFARALQKDPVIPGLEFLRVEVNGNLESTYQFAEGVADTSLAALTAERLGVTFDRLSEAIARRGARFDGQEPDRVEPERGKLR